MFNELIQAASKFPLSPLGMTLTNAHVIDVKTGTITSANLLLPHRPRSSDIAPRLLADNAAYTFAMGEKRAKKLHAAYIELLQRYAEEAHDADAQAVVAYLSLHPEPPKEVVDDPRVPITFSNAEKMIATSPHLIQWWQHALFDGNDGTMIYAVCGQEKPVPSCAHAKVLGLPARHTFGSALSPAQFSNDPETVCGWCGATVVTVLNYLLSSPQNHVIIKDVAILYWSSVDKDCSAAVSGNKEGGVMGDAPNSGNLQMCLLKDNEKRLCLLGWISIDLSQVARYLERFNHLQEKTTDTPALAPLALVRMIAPILSGSGPITDTTLALVKQAFTGCSLPPTFARLVQAWTQRTGGDPLGARLAVLLATDQTF